MYGELAIDGYCIVMYLNEVFKRTQDSEKYITHGKLILILHPNYQTNKKINKNWNTHRPTHNFKHFNHACVSIKAFNDYAMMICSDENVSLKLRKWKNKSFTFKFK